MYVNKPGFSVWGTPHRDIGEGFCLSCEHQYPHHYTCCRRVSTVEFKREKVTT